MEVSKNILHVGVNDRQIDLFEGQYIAPNGMAYNSYVITDEKVAVFDAVDALFVDEWLGNVKNALNGRQPDFLIVQHVEPDHSAGIKKFMEVYENAKIVATAGAFTMLKNLYCTDYSAKAIVAKDGDKLSLGSHQLTFVTAPMVHWPEVMMTYEQTEKVLFSADAFGKFGAYDHDEEWACEARRYYFGIVGKFGVQVQQLLKKLSGVEVNAICPLHGVVLKENLGYYLNLYNVWSSYGTETEGVFIAYTSVYGNTKQAVELMKETLIKAGCKKVATADLAREDMAECVEDAFRYGKIILATTTYNGGIFPFMNDFIHHLVDHNYQNKTIAFMENGSWNPMAAKVMKQNLEGCKNLRFIDSTVRILGCVKPENIEQMQTLATKILK